ncbi:SRPBCC family protein [Nocardiopsis sp. RSe5-2]|uniref:SRPBCC family protein n=1 Tax=Nocardiopsis endophytica TaxID=3018445 RepID=A0ABT4U9A0_9ACTN|nr:SRPBCC family protein [Nocardiopsis endophytica]MDA2812990.1 SRPBCC family protein [Nocardiopsis endophytica]
MSGHTDNSVVIDAPLHVVWTMTNDIESWPTLFTEYAEATVLERAGGRIRFRLTTHPNDDGQQWSWVSERIPDPAEHTVRAQRIERGPFKFMHLFWEFTEVPEGTRMRWVQDFEVREDAPFDDERMTAHLNRTSPEQMRHIKAAVERVAAVKGGKAGV